MYTFLCLWRVFFACLWFLLFRFVCFFLPLVCSFGFVFDLDLRNAQYNLYHLKNENHYTPTHSQSSGNTLDFQQTEHALKHTHTHTVPQPHEYTQKHIHSIHRQYAYEWKWWSDSDSAMHEPYNCQVVGKRNIKYPWFLDNMHTCTRISCATLSITMCLCKFFFSCCSTLVSIIRYIFAIVDGFLMH